MKAFLILFLFLLSIPSLAQLSEDIIDLKPELINSELKKDYSEFAKTSTNELQVSVAAFFYFYKHTISSQDGNRCTFYPSCSTYAVRSIREKGLITGCMATSDRLSRCHHGNEKDYKHHNKSGLKFDPVRD